jgi:hypothetical protein
MMNCLCELQSLAFGYGTAGFGNGRKQMSTQKTMAHTQEPAEINAFYLFGCMTLWRKTGNIQAGWELICALASPDPGIQSMAEAVLHASERPSKIPVLCTAYVW